VQQVPDQAVVVTVVAVVVAVVAVGAGHAGYSEGAGNRDRGDSDELLGLGHDLGVPSTKKTRAS
jgi:hypothetical protein